MHKQYDESIKLLIIKLIEEKGEEIEDLVEQFDISQATIYRWHAQYKKIGNVKNKPKKRGGRKIDDALLIATIENNPDLTLIEIGEKINAKRSTVFAALKRLGYKKKDYEL